MNPTQYSHLSNATVLMAAVIYFIAFLSHLYEWAFSRQVASVREMAVVGGGEALSTASNDQVRRERVEWAGRFGVTMTAIGFAIQAVAVVSRGLAAERVPWGNMYEFTITGCAASVVTYLIWLKFQPIRWLGLPITGLSVVLLMVAVLILDVPAGPLVPALQSYWLYIHVTAAMIATGAFTVGALASIMFLVRDRARQTGRGESALSSRLPEPEIIDRFSYQIHAFAFPVWTFAALIAGPIWAKYAWGRYWGWDPKEVWAFITWVAYAAYLHARATAGWRGRRAAMLALAGFAALWFNFIGVNFFISGLHSYAGK